MQIYLVQLGKRRSNKKFKKSIENKYKKMLEFIIILGCLSIDIENFEDAIEYLKKTLELDPKINKHHSI